MGIISDFKRIRDRLEHGPVERDLQEYREILEKVNRIGFSRLNDSEIKEKSQKLIEQVRNGINPDKILPEAFALVREAAKRVLGLYPFDVQVMAGIAMHKRKLVEMQTGEGKTLAAVFPAYLNALPGNGVHILTFNDYLAKRDAEWMGPVYCFLGLRVGYVREGMNIEERKDAYACDITYLTAKEAGFDYLRDCLCYEKTEMAHRGFHYALLDEADSILIDEARIPLVIAGSVFAEEGLSEQMAALVKRLEIGIDFALDEYGRNVNLTERGISKVEEILHCGNLYATRNLDKLTALNAALHAEALLKKDVDYIVRNDHIELIDEFTGRVADKRHWPDGLQAAIEAKEGLGSQSKGRILGSITLQNYLKLYKGICGMTATARTSAEELMEFYRLEVVVIPSNKPCIRVDRPDMVYATREDKNKAVVGEMKREHAAGRPLLIGTASIEESERLAKLLSDEGMECRVLNAKNDELEAGIIARAGELGAITVSTNMAGRGTDIRLGGPQEEDREKVVELGGLYVIGTSRHESRRIDNQLRGRAGRQGDPGESRFFISLEDDLAEKYGIDRLIPEEFKKTENGSPLNSRFVNHRINHIQKLIEGQNTDTRRTLGRYSIVLEEQRKIVQNRRLAVLLEEEPVPVLAAECPEIYARLEMEIGETVLRRVEKYIALYQIDKFWADHLEFSTYIQDGIHLVSICGKNPLDEFHKSVIEAFEDMGKRIAEAVVETFNTIRLSKDGVDFEKEGLKRPTSTWTYMVSDDYFINNLGTKMINGGNQGFASMAAAFSGPMVLGGLIYERFFKKKIK